MSEWPDWQHIYPLNDLRDHITDGFARGLRCWCKPTIDEEANLVIHNALDGREQIETGEAKVQ